MNNELPFKILTDADFLDRDYTKRDELEGLIESVLCILRNHPGDSRLDSVAWRLADAGLLLRRIMKHSSWKNVQGVGGIDCPTGFGAMLPKDQSDSSP